MGSSRTELRTTWPMLRLVLLLAACSVVPQTAMAQETLKLRETKSPQIGGGQTQSFTISLTRDQFAEIAIEQRGAMLSATLLDPQGNAVIEMDYLGGGFGPIYLSTIATSTGNYKLNVQSINSWANPANYDVTIISLRNPTPEDRALNDAQTVFSNGRKNLRAGKPAEAIEAYKRSLTYWAAVNNYHWQALTQYALSEAYRTRDREKSVAALNEALRILEIETAPNDWRLKASVLNDLGPIYSSSGDTEKALASLNAALELYKTHADRRGQASALGNLGFLHFNLGNLSLARELIDKALALRLAENDKPGIGNLINALAAISDRLGEPERALEYATRSLAIWEEAGTPTSVERSRMAAVLNNLAAINDKLGRWDLATNFYDRALALYDEGDSGRASPLDNKGELYAALGNPTKARECYDEALKVLAAAGKPNLSLKAGILVHIGQLFLAERDSANALRFFADARDLKPSDPRLADVYTNLGVAFTVAGDLAEAMKAYEEALKIQTRLTDQRGLALVLQKRGETRALMGKTNEALDDFSSAITIWRAVKDRRGEASTLNNIARLERDRGNLEAGLARSAEAIRIVESLRTGISNRQLRASYFAAHENYYELDIDLKMQLSRKERRTEYLAAALESAERSRARVLLDTLNEAGLSKGDFNPTSDPRIVKLREEWFRLLNQLAAKNEARTKALSLPHRSEQIAIFDREINQLSDACDALETRIRSEDSRFASLSKPQPATLAEIQEQLDADTLLVEYFLGQSRSYVWIVSRDSIDGIELAPRAEIDAAAERTYEALSARGKEEQHETDDQKLERIVKSESKFNDASTRLSQMVLDQIGSRLGRKRLVVVSDGALQTLPIGVLPFPPNMVLSATAEKQKSASGLASSRPLLSNNEIVNVPSASVLVLQRRELARRTRAPLALAVLADPVFDVSDSRVGSRDTSKKSAPSTPSATSSRLSSNNAAQTRALSNMGFAQPGAIRRLIFSAEEAHKILGFVPPGQALEALGFEANRATAMSPALSRYRIIHFATHAVLNPSHPEWSGILFSMVDKQGRPETGYLGLNELYNLNLPAELVVLSACETGIGKEVRGEGLIALTRGFMYAGAKRVVASLWKVDDRATSELMGEFYKQMLVNKLTPAAALRVAQLKLSEQRRWRNPHFWAGFVLKGEWR